MEAPEGGTFFMGMWMPATERHFIGMMKDHSKVGVVRGRGTYQKHKLDLAMKRVPLDRRRVAVDIGAHVGLWSVWLIRLFERVEAFEPVPLHAKLFTMNVPGKVDPDETVGNYWLHQVALGDREGTVGINVPSHTTGNATVAEGGNERAATVTDVKMITLDSLNLPIVDFIKIDVEGYELQVLRGAAETIKRCRPYLVVEQKGNDEKLYRRERNEGLRFCLHELGMKSLGEYAGDHILGWPEPVVDAA